MYDTVSFGGSMFDIESFQMKTLSQVTDQFANGGTTCASHGSSMAYNSTRSSGQLLIQRLSETATLPERQTPDAAGFDITADQDFEVPARGVTLVPTGLAVLPPLGTYVRIAPRSSLACYGLGVNGGVVDRDYTAEVKVVMQSFLDTDYHGRAGDRVAQLVIEKIALPKVVEVESLPSTPRLGGFGSTGQS